jgi:competence protein ComEC
LEVTALDVGQGDAILVTTPHGKHLLVDGGPSGIGLARELGATLPHWQRSIDIVALTHPQQDHIAGLVELLERYHAGEVMESGSRNPTPADELYQQRAGPRRVLKAGDAIDLDGVHVEVLWPPAGYEPKGLNDTSLILRLTYGETRVLLTGDSEAPAHRQLMAGEDVAADILKVPHHGSKTSDPEFLRAVNPAVSLISVGVGNQFGHPAASTLETLGGSKILRTDQCGRVTVSSDGHTLRMKTARRGSECP